MLRKIPVPLRKLISNPVTIKKTSIPHTNYSQYASIYSSIATQMHRENQTIWENSSAFKQQRIWTVVNALDEMSQSEKEYLNYLIMRDSLEVEINGGIKTVSANIETEGEDLPIKIFSQELNYFEDKSEFESISKFLNSCQNQSGNSGSGSASNDEGKDAESDVVVVEEIVEQTKFTVKLIEVPAAKKLVTIKEVKAQLGVGLKDAKEMVESIPVELKVDVSKEEAELLRDKMTELGCGVEIV